MLNPAHLLEIALLLLVAFLAGATIGSLARLLTLRLLRPKAAPSAAVASPADPAAGLPSQAAETPALVAAPVIGEVVRTPTPTAPAHVPALDFTEALLALAGDKPGDPAPKIHIPSMAPLPAMAVTKTVEQIGPARVAGATTSGRAVAHPRAAAKPIAVAVITGASAEVIPFPLDKIAAEPALAPAAVATLLEVSAAEIVTDAADLVNPSTENSGLDREAEQKPAATNDAGLDLPPPDAADEPEAPGETNVAPVLPELAVDASPLDAAPEVASDDVAATEQHAPAAPTVADDETAAMRAIEGNWSPRRTSIGKARRVELPEVAADEAVLASGAAVSSAERAAQLAIAPEVDEPLGKPQGIAAPRLGVKDELTHVIGILPIIEIALNRLGLYHFDQIADLTDENAGWIEAHLGIVGRIGREHWREQAREIAVAMASAKQAAGS